ncbi:hypothetical protein [Burkholderia ubonensis]|uniref:hypothetical protein n=1 Tax=Burkholderia ubonensis TaxID=101571 RepID=UPI00075B1F2C|nr:hypothetical protein [Burkholderia ubonensis]AOI70866.1 hypothetical protein WI31_15710 [Burkholderia ubonensis]KUZ07411.1 hypothetical protein WI29_34165 [Burkholderia ubonensis]KUZ20651.1 hypothetical protein WI30_01350 [Burkholderia ubonensis]KUZ42048.1 hypothetical protein WI32_03145 [Burkholderia ubonensis]KUZ56854.1 hypothetical protein WI33_04680 [Burkholderia ubonensis]
MKNLIRYLLLRHQLASVASHLEAVQKERSMLEHSERFYLRQAADLRLKLLNLDIRARRA